MPSIQAEHMILKTIPLGWFFLMMAHHSPSRADRIMAQHTQAANFLLQTRAQFDLTEAHFRQTRPQNVSTNFSLNRQRNQRIR